jgi:hypothetical protein
MVENVDANDDIEMLVRIIEGFGRTDVGIGSVVVPVSRGRGHRELDVVR